MNESRIIMHEGCAVFVNRSTVLLVKETSWNREERGGVEGLSIPLTLMVDGQKTFDFSMWAPIEGLLDLGTTIAEASEKVRPVQKEIKNAIICGIVDFVLSTSEIFSRRFVHLEELIKNAEANILIWRAEAGEK